MHEEIEMFYVNTPQPYTHTFSLSSPVITKRSQTLQIQRCKRNGTKEKDAQNAIEDSRDVVRAQS